MKSIRAGARSASCPPAALRKPPRVLGGPRAGGHSILEVEGGPSAALDAVRRLRGRDVLSAEPLLARQRLKRAVPNDPFLAQQWHLDEARVPGAWTSSASPGITGQGVTIGIIDDGVQHSHPDLAANYDAANSYDFNERDSNPEPGPFLGDDHGTACAGLAAAVGNNGLGVAGVAYRAKFAALRLLTFATTDEEEAEAFLFRNSEIAIKSNSWGSGDSGSTMAGAGALGRAAIEQGAAEGRNGLGTIYLFSGGNARTRGGNANFDAFTALRETISVTAVDRSGVFAPYAEPGANHLVAGPSSGFRLDVLTTDRRGLDGYNSGLSFFDTQDADYTGRFGGTSAACPIVAGVVALMLEANPGLGWRDVQEILVRTARTVDAGDVDWVTNGAGLDFNHNYGAGLVDAQAAVALARTWQNLGPNLKIEQEHAGLATAIPDGKQTGVEFTFHVPTANFRVEHVLLTTDIAHHRRGQIAITITSPDGTVSRIAEPRPRDRGAHLRWTFLSTHCWGEQAQGDWKVRVVDTRKGTTGTVHRLKLTLWGAASGGSLVGGGVEGASDGQPLPSLPLPGSHTVDLVVRNQGTQTLSDITPSLVTVSPGTGEILSGPIASLAPGEAARLRVSLSTAQQTGGAVRIGLGLDPAGGPSSRVHYELPVGRIETFVLRSDEPTAIPADNTRKAKGKAGVYPLRIFATGFPENAVIVDVRLRLRQFTHLRGNDLDLLLEAPDGTAMVPMSDAGRRFFFEEDFELRDDADVALGTHPLPSGGAMRPANLDARPDRFPKPAPPRPHGFSFSTFRGISPVGEWRLYIVDDDGRPVKELNDVPSIGGLGGWELEIVCASPP
jgi:subtilisin-like proprotein convertase family protein/subtilisin family serine protease